MISSVQTPVSAALKGAAFVVGGLACFAVVVAAGIFALAMTLVLTLRRPIAALDRRVQTEADPHLKTASVS